jgi:hypothetical protein
MANALDGLEEHAVAWEAAADRYEADYGRGHLTRGYPAQLRAMAAQVRVAKSEGRVPHEYVSTGPQLWGAAEAAAATDKMVQQIAENIVRALPQPPPEVDRTLGAIGLQDVCSLTVGEFDVAAAASNVTVEASARLSTKNWLIKAGRLVA